MIFFILLSITISEAIIKLVMLTVLAFQEAQWYRICQAGEVGLIPRLVLCPAEGNGNQHQSPCLGNPTDRRATESRLRD